MLLPQPEGPISAVTLLRGMARLTSRTARKPPYQQLTFSRSRAGFVDDVAGALVALDGALAPTWLTEGLVTGSRSFIATEGTSPLDRARQSRTQDNCHEIEQEHQHKEHQNRCS